jgi:hypothetical protein
MSDHQVLRVSADGTINPRDFLAFGVGEVAYVRPVRMMNKSLFAIHAADGTPLSIFDNETDALKALEDQDLDPVKIH